MSRNPLTAAIFIDSSRKLRIVPEGTRALNVDAAGLALRRKRMSRFDSRRGAVRLWLPATDGELSLDAGEQVSMVDRLDDKLTDSQGYSRRSGGHIILGGDQDDRERGRKPLQFSAHLKPIHAGHHDVQEDHVHRVAAYGL